MLSCITATWSCITCAEFRLVASSRAEIKRHDLHTMTRAKAVCNSLRRGPLHRAELVCKDAIYKNANNDGRYRGDLCLRKEGTRGIERGRRYWFEAITRSYLNSLQLARHGLKFNENSLAIKLLDTTYIGRGWFINPRKCAVSSVSTISLDSVWFRMRPSRKNSFPNSFSCLDFFSSQSTIFYFQMRAQI